MDHEKFFLENVFYSDNKNRIAQYLNGAKVNLFYPGTGRDVFTPLKYLNEQVDEFFFNDKDKEVAKWLGSKDFHKHVEELGFSLLEASEKTDGEFPISTFKFSVSGREITICYLHCFWEDAYKWFRAKQIDINFLYLYGFGGEGGCEFATLYEKGEDGPYKLADLLTSDFVVIEEGQLKFRNLNQYQSKQSIHFEINDIHLEIRFSEIVDSKENLDGVFITTNDSIDVLDGYDPFIHSSPQQLCNSKQHVIEYDPDMEEAEFIKVLLNVAETNKWDTVGTGSQVYDNFEEFFMPIKQWNKAYPKRIILFERYLPPTAGVRHASLIQ